MNFDIGGNDITFIIGGIKIHQDEDNKCTVCKKNYPFRLSYWATDISGVKEVKIITAHPACRNLVEKKKKILSQLTNVEWQLYRRCAM